MKNHLPVYGPGPVYGAVLSAATLLGIWLQKKNILPVITVSGLAVWEKILGTALILAAAVMWCLAVLKKRIGDHIVNNELVTDGVYGWVRNPIYAAILFLMWGLILWADNLLLWILGLSYWGFLTVLMKCTEEKWLQTLYGEPYREYCRRVNRCIPWFPQTGGK